MRRDDALRAILRQARRVGAALVVGNGQLCRAAYVDDDPSVFYMFGSMSLAPAIAIGYATGSGRPCVAVEGDGNALMGLSGLPLAAGLTTSFVHVVLDNGRYESTGGQPTLAGRVDLCGMAAAAGYERVATVSDLGRLRAALGESLTARGATYLRIPVLPQDGPPPPRVPLHPRQITQRFRAAAARTDETGIGA